MPELTLDPEQLKKLPRHQLVNLARATAVAREKGYLAAAKADFTRWRDDPVGFARQVLGVEPWAVQEAIMRSVAARARTTVRSCHNSGKSFAAACLAQWWVRCYSPSLVITTAPTERQVKDVLWHEISSRQRAAGLPGALNVLSLVVGPQQRALGFTTREPERFQGLHEQNILVIVDEASGVDEPIYAAIEGILTGPNARLLLIGNPNNAVGSFFESFRSPLYHEGRFHIAASDVPETILPRQWAAERRAEWGEESPLYHVRVLGNFPAQGEDSLISLQQAEDAQARLLPAGTPVECGLDVSRYGGDETVIYARAGAAVIGADYWRGQDTMTTAGRALAFARQHGARLLRVDDPGVGGGVTDRLQEEARGSDLAVHGINVGERARNPEQFYDRRSEAYWGLRERFKTGDISIPADDQTLVDQLTQIRFFYTPRGQIRIEGKDELRKKRPAGTRWQSPDRSDGLMLTYLSGDNPWIPAALAGDAVSVALPGWG